MSYIKATDVLPEELLELIQKYVEGEYIYIPRKECNKRNWGEITKSKKDTNARNTEIYEKYKEGITTKVLSEMYYLSSKSIQKIVLKIKRENQ